MLFVEIGSDGQRSKMELVGSDVDIPGVINGVDVSAVVSWFTSNGGERGMDVEISAAAESSEHFLYLFGVVAMHWAPLEKIAHLKEMVEYDSFMGSRQEGATRHKVKGPQWSMMDGNAFNSKINTIAKDILNQRFPFAAQAYRIGVTITDPSFEQLIQKHCGLLKACLYLHILKSVGSSGQTIATARRYIAAVDKFLVARASGVDISSLSDETSSLASGADAAAPWSNCADRTGGEWRSFVVQHFNAHCDTGNAASRLIDFPGVGGCAGLVLVHLVILESLYPELGLELPTHWMSVTCSSGVCFEKGQAQLVLQSVIDDPLSAILNPSVESGRTLREECTVMLASFKSNASDDVCVYSSLNVNDYMDAGNIAMFMSRKLEQQMYVRRVVSKNGGGEADTVSPFPNFMETGSFTISRTIAKDIGGDAPRDWRWQIAYMCGVGSGHTCLLVDTSAGVDLFA